jgi:hypothetical protein
MVRVIIDERALDPRAIEMLVAVLVANGRAGERAGGSTSAAPERK